MVPGWLASKTVWYYTKAFICRNLKHGVQNNKHNLVCTPVYLPKYYGIKQHYVKRTTVMMLQSRMICSVYKLKEMAAVRLVHCHKHNSHDAAEWWYTLCTTETATVATSSTLSQTLFSTPDSHSICMHACMGGSPIAVSYCIMVLHVDEQQTTSSSLVVHLEFTHDHSCLRALIYYCQKMDSKPTTILNSNNNTHQ